MSQRREPPSNYAVPEAADRESLGLCGTFLLLPGGQTPIGKTELAENRLI